MSKFIINGQKPLSGEIKIKGAKNLALKVIPASILSEKPMTIGNLPKIEDIDKSLQLIREMGFKVELKGDKVIIESKNVKTFELSDKLADKFRTSIMFVGPLLARFKKIKFPHPGGCVIGAGGRPIDLFLDGFSAMGAKIKASGKYYFIEAKKLKGMDFFFPKVSVTGTESLMMTACLAEGQTILRNCAMEPEIKYLADYLNENGAKIKGAGTSMIVIDGVKKMGAGKIEIMPDRIEAGSFAILAAATNSEILIKDCNPEHVSVLLAIFKRIGVNFETGKNWIKMKKRNKIKAYSIQTHEYPGFPTDLQSPYAVLMTQADGMSLIHETIYDRRLIWTDMLSQMGANITMCDPHRVVINGPSKLYGKKLISPDIRAGIGLVIAALMAKGRTEIDNIYQIDRGYEKIDERLRRLGADIVRVD
ncbi:UDP-N-acetylglucosamine 1-carboxyvinyltransferase [Candidatus Falkowbacteria bacterium HGW-Falkowbacteria-1]|jgi:UDP-N-acetylglucosamine 1-carboxyvinyltransferase|uniref:UDP-N-acetylglucosamine 1-carboxyvinyltransferase n=1 Tax=Candidatus Falkowbacteria bacterium HGW-Falkowbacteria-1 TaxID=2013768 RepID=A0A2N2EAC5_9BACT|nr:MAG: UDP-N-acetylglucosamine 1-carboxyvinyltransferase [Candidatus Falkowbacteria bacterium HGW-Falkowbacteria-1]